jgi:hypothetical protein
MNHSSIKPDIIVKTINMNHYAVKPDIIAKHNVVPFLSDCDCVREFGLAQNEKFDYNVCLMEE